MNTYNFRLLDFIKLKGIVMVVIAIAFFAFAGSANAAVTGVTVTAPTAGDAWNATQNITWNCTDDGVSPTCADVSLDSISYSPDGGTTWEPVGYTSGPFASVGTFSWNTLTGNAGGPNTESLNGKIRVILNSAGINNTTGVFTLDNTSETITSVTTKDTDGNGKLDKLVVVFSDSLDPSITDVSGFSYTSAKGTTIDTTTAGVWSQTAVPNDTLTISLTENTNTCDYTSQTGCDTDDTSNVSYTAGTLKDLAGNLTTAYGPTPVTDGAKPVMVGAKTDDTDNDGMIDRINVRFSEDLLDATVTGSDFDVDTYSVLGASENLAGHVEINLTESGTPDTDATPIVSIKTGEVIKDDPAGNILGNGDNGSTITPTDGAGPAVVDRAYLDNDGDGTVDFVKLTWSEDVDDSTISVSDFELSLTDAAPTPGDLTLTESYTSGTPTTGYETDTANDDVTYVGVTSGTDSIITDTTFYATFYARVVGTVDDLATTPNSSVAEAAGVAVSDEAKPVVIDTATLDTDSDGNVDSIELKFSEDVTDFAAQVGDWALSSDSSTWDAFSNFNTTATVLPGGSDTDANDEYVTLSLTPSNVSGTGVMQYKYANGGTNITDLNGNVLANINATNAADKAAPVVTKIAYTDPNHDGTVDTLNMYLSEPLSTVTPDYGDFGIVGGNIHLAYSHNNNGDITFDATENILKWSHLDADVAKTSAGANNPRITYTQNLGSLTDAAGLEMLNFVHKEAVDEARPVALDAIGTNKSQYTAYGHTGSIDQVLLYFTEPVRTRGGNSSDFDNSAWTETENGLTGFDVTAGADSITDDAFYLTASSDNITGVGAGTEPTLAYGGADYGNATIEDTAGNSAAAFTVNLTDRADPVLVDFVANPNPAGLGDSLGFTLKFSEPMDNTTALTGTTFDTNPSSGPYTVSNINYSGDTWTADFSANPISAGNPKSGTHTFGTPVSSGKDPAGNNMSILSGLDMTFVVDSQRPFTSGLEVTPAVSGLNTPVLVTATIQDDLDLASGSAKLYIEKDDTTVAGPLTMTPGNSSNNGKTKTFTLPIIPSALGLSAGNTYNVYVLGTDSTGNSDLLDIDGDGASDTLTETLTVSSDVTPPAITMTGENTTVNIDADTYAISGAVTPGDFTVVKVFKMIGNTPAPGDVEVGTFALGPSETNWEVTISLPQNATSKYYAEAHDLPNNNTSTTGILTITESDASTDTTAPTLTSTAPDSEQTVGSVADVVFTFADETAFDATASNNIVNFTMDGSDVKTDTKTSASVSGTTLTVTYSDANMPAGVHNFNIKIKDAAGNTREASATVSVVNPNDTLAPTLTYVNTPPVTAITQTTARVVFTSDEGGLAQAAYGTSLSYGNLTPWQVMGASQNTITLGGLSCGTTYHVKIQGKDASSNISETSDATFTTLACSDTTAPEFTSSFSNVVTAGFDVTVSADEAFDVMIEADDDSNFGSVDATIAYSGTTATGPLTKTINGLSADTLYFVRVTVKDAAGNTRSQVYTQQTAQGGPVNLTNLSLSNITDTGATINWTTDNTPASAQYRVSTTAYSGTWNNMSVSGTSGTQNLTGLTPGTTYYYQVSFTKNGQTSYSIPMSFTTASASTGISVDSIQAIKTYASADDNWTNGWKWVFNVTVNDMLEHNLAMKFDQWVSGTNTLDAANNMRYSIDDTTWTPISANSTYGANIDISGVDLDASRGGRQVKVYVEMKVPTGTVGGSYSTSYGIQTSTN